MSLVGKPLPTFSLQDTAGSTITPEDLKGKWVILYAYPKDATPGCTQEACDFRDSHAALTRLGALVVGISRDTPASHHRFTSQQTLPFPLLSDPEALLLKALGAFGPKVMYGKETVGIIRSTFLVDPTGVIRHVWPKVSVKGHVAEVAQTLARLTQP